MDPNITRKRKADDEPVELALGVRRRANDAVDDGSAICKMPTRSIPPPERPGSIQSSLAFASESADTAQLIERFEYTPLHKGEFRLLRLHQGQADEQIHCSLVHDKIDAPSSYEALSYTWGSPHPVSDVFLSHEDHNGTFAIPKLCGIGMNLHDALKRLRLPDRPVVLWVDALCIDQSSFTERSEQVAKMSAIYKNAHRIMVWLGEETTATRWALSHLGTALSPEFFNRSEDETVPFISAVMDLFKRPWFQRRWVVQEVALARDVMFQCGSAQVDARDFDTLRELMSRSETSVGMRNIDIDCDSQHQLGIELSALQRTSTLFDLANRAVRRSSDGRVIGQSNRLIDLVLGTRHLQSTDPRDAIYALLGLAKDGWSHNGQGSSLLHPDYTKSTLQVFSDFVEHCVQGSESLDIILQPWAPLRRPKIYGSQKNRSPETVPPSWMCLLETLPLGEPGRKAECGCSSSRRVNGDILVGITPSYNTSGDFAANVRFGPLVRRTSNRIVKKGKTQGNTATEPTNGTHRDASEQPLGEIENPVLIAQGLELGTITDLSMRMAGGIVSRDCLEMCGMSFAEGCEARHNTPTNVWERLWHTLVADRDPSGRPAPSRYAHAFFSIFKQVLRLRSMDTTEMLDEDPDENVAEFLKRVRDVIWNRRMFRSSMVNSFDENLLGLAPREAQVGDKIVLLFGCSVPVIMRSDADAGEGYLRIIGAAYVYNKMEGEALFEMDMSSIDARSTAFHIV